MKLLTMCSTCQRPVLLQRMAESYLATSREKDSRLVIYVNQDDPKVDEYRVVAAELEKSKKIVFTFGAARTMVQVLNDFSCKDYPDCSYYSECNDDHVFKTIGWDLIMMDAIDRKNNGVSVAYGKTQLYPTATMHGAKLVHGLGYFFPPEYQHTLVDFWLMKIGFGAGIMTYVPEVLIDHLHPAFNKAPWDTVYDKERVDTTTEGKYQVWLKTKLATDIQFVESVIMKNKFVQLDALPDVKEAVTVIMEVKDSGLLTKTLQSYTLAGARPPRLYAYGGNHLSKAMVMKLPEAIWIENCQDKSITEIETALFNRGAYSVLFLTSSCLFKKGWWKTIRSMTDKSDFTDTLSFFNNGTDVRLGKVVCKAPGNVQPKQSLFQTIMPGEAAAPDFDVRSIGDIINEERIRAEMVEKFPADFGPEHEMWKIPSKRNQWLKLHGEMLNELPG